MKQRFYMEGKIGCAGEACQEFVEGTLTLEFYEGMLPPRFTELIPDKDYGKWYPVKDFWLCERCFAKHSKSRHGR